MFKVITIIVFKLFCLWLGVKGSVSFVNSRKIHWHARHVFNHVEVNLYRCTTLYTVYRKIRHEVWHLVQLRDNKEWLLWFERIQPLYVEAGFGNLFYAFSFPEIEAKLYELGMRPPCIFEGTCIQELQDAHEHNVLLPSLSLHVRQYLCNNHLEHLEESLGLNIHLPWENTSF